MFSPGFAHLIVLFISFVLILLSIFLYRNYRKTSIVLFVLAIAWSISLFWGEPWVDKYGAKFYVGEYRFDPSKSKYGAKNVDKYKDCILNVYANNTFEIRGSLPLVNNKGKWYYKDNGDWGWIEYRFIGTKQPVEILSPNPDEWIFIEEILPDSGSDTLTFVKVKNRTQ